MTSNFALVAEGHKLVNTIVTGASSIRELPTYFWKRLEERVKNQRHSMLLHLI
jgi:hypothetical protein